MHLHTSYLLQDDTNTTTIQPLNFQLIIIKVKMS